MAQHDRRAVAGDLDQIFGGIGAGRTEEVTTTWSTAGRSRPASCANVRLPGSPRGEQRRKGCAAMSRASDTGEPDDSQAAASGRSGDGDDGVVEVHMTGWTRPARSGDRRAGRGHRRGPDGLPRDDRGHSVRASPERTPSSAECTGDGSGAGWPFMSAGYTTTWRPGAGRRSRCALRFHCAAPDG